MTAPAGQDRSGPRKWYQRPLSERAVAVAVVLAVAVGALTAVVGRWIPIYDDALIELRVRDVPAHLPLVGSWSRFGWNHPGPVHFYFLSVFYWLGARHSEALLVGALVMHLCFGWIAWYCAKGISALAGALVAAGALAIVVTTPPTVLRDPWNPYVTLLGALALCCAAWSLAERNRPGAFALFPVGTFLVQAHLVTAPFVVVVCLAALACLLPGHRGPLPGRALGAGVLLAGVLWLPPLLQQLTGDPGNLSRILHSPGSGPRLSVGEVARVMSHALALWPDVLNPVAMRADDMATSGWALPVWLVFFAAAFVVILRRGEHTLLRGAVVAGAALTGSTISVALLSGAPHNYLALARRGSVVFVLVICVLVLADLRSWPRARVLQLVRALSIVLALLAAGLQLPARNPLQPAGAAVEQFVAAIRSEGLPRELGLELTTRDLDPGEIYFALLDALEREGYLPNALSLGEMYVGAHRTERRVDYMLTVGSPGSERRLRARGWRIIAVHQPFGPRQRERLRVSRDAAEIERIRRGRVAVVLAGRPVSPDD